MVRPSLAADPRANPILGFDNYESGTTSVLRWRGDTWESFGPNIPGTSGPSIGLDADKRIYLCQSGKYATPGATLNVSRSIGKVWRQIGGDIAIEARYVTGPRHLVDKLRWIAPVSVFVGAKSWAVFAVQWDEDQKSWKGLGDG